MNDATGVANSTDGARISVYEDDIQYTNYESAGKQIFNVGTNGGTNAMNIDANGVVSMPKQPAFRGEGFAAGVASNGTTGYNASNSHYKVRTIELNNGNHFDNTNGIFTCPTAGLYYCYNEFSRSTDNWVGVQLIQNTTAIHLMWFRVSSRTNAEYDVRELQSVVSCAANDKLYFTYANGYTAPANNNYTRMTIFKIA